MVELIGERRAEIATATGVDLELASIAVRSTSKDRGTAVDPALLTTDADALVTDPSIDVVVEVIGGIEPARTLIQNALKSGKPVITANKELLANVGAELYQTADANGVDLLFEAAAAGAIPIVRPLRESLLGEDVTAVMGILNGTTNYILTRMAFDGATYADALSEAQHLGYAERDPTADVEGYDAGAKAAIMASLAFGQNVVAGDVYHEGIANITQSDIGFARRLGYEIKLLGIAERFVDPGGDPRGQLAVRVHPAMVPEAHPLASVRDSFNAVFVEGAAAGELMFYGRGAGGRPTASAVLGDLVDAATNKSRGTHRPVPSGERGPDPPHRRAGERLLPQRRGRRRPRGAGHRGRGVRPPRGVDPIDGAGGPRHRGPGWRSSPTAPGNATSGPPSTTSATSTSSPTCSASSGSSATEHGRRRRWRSATAPPGVRHPTWASPTSSSPAWPPTAACTAPSTCRPCPT